MSFWAEGFWAGGFWAPEFWQEAAPAPAEGRVVLRFRSRAATVVELSSRIWL
jgi:hypothetical protein